MNIDLPVEIDIEYLEDGINVNHFVSKEEGNGYAKQALNEIIAKAENEGYEYVVINIGNNGQKDSAEFLEEIGFEIIESHKDHITAEFELD